MLAVAATDERVLFKADHFAHETFQSNQNLGAVEVATFLGMTLYGLSLSQGYTFFARGGYEDTIGLKLLVSLILFMETFHSFVAGQTIYFDTVTNWTKAQANSYPLSVTVLTENIITLMVQCFFCHRVYRLSNTHRISGPCLFLVILRFAGGVALSVESFLDVPKIPNGQFVATFSWLITLALSLGAAADMLIALAMSYYLRKLASPTNLKSTTAVINRLIRWSLQTGSLTSLASISVIISFQATTNMVWFALYIPLAKLYSISLLASLNARRMNRRNMSGSNAACSQVGASDLEFGTIQLSRHNASALGGLEMGNAAPVWEAKTPIRSVAM